MQYILPNCYRFLLSLPINNKNYYSPKKLLFDCSFRMSHSVSSTTTTTKSITTATTTTTTATTTITNNDNQQWQQQQQTMTTNNDNNNDEWQQQLFRLWKLVRIQPPRDEKEAMLFEHEKEEQVSYCLVTAFIHFREMVSLVILS